MVIPLRTLPRYRFTSVVLVVGFGVGGLAAVSGCGTVPRTQFDAISAQNRVLLEQRRTNLAEIDKLKSHARDVEDRLIESQQRVSRLESESEQRVSHRASADAVDR